IRINLLALPIGVMSGLFFMGGDIISCLFISLILMYSLKFICISLPVKLVVILFGVLYTNTGGMVSLGPPDMVPLLAQLFNDKSEANNTTADRYMINLVLRIQSPFNSTK